MTAVDDRPTTETADPLLPRLIERLAESDLPDDAQYLVVAAYEGADELESLLDGTATGALPDARAGEPVEVPHAWIERITVAGFRGIGPEASLHLKGEAGLTLVVGRNGSGKSSFAEAAEIALTGANARWESRTAAWRDGWQNLHRGDTPPSVTVDLQVTGEPGLTRVHRTWSGDRVTDSEVWTQRHGARREPGGLGWDEALVSYRPFLSYSELGAMLNGRPSDMYDSLFRILGLQRLVDAQDRLKAALDVFKEEEKQLKAEREDLLDALAGIDDERAGAVAEELRKRAPDLDVLRGLLRAEVGPVGDLAPLRAWSTLAAPDVEEATAAADALEAAVAAVADLADGDSEQARRLAALLEAALDHARHAAGRDCPVCGTADRLDDAWRAATVAEVARLKQAATAADAAHAALRSARARVEDVVRVPALLRTTPPAGVAGEGLADRWAAWAAAAQADAAAALAALRDGTASLAAAVRAAAAGAAEQLRRREDAWQPLAQRLREHVDRAAEVVLRSDTRAHLDAACTWLRAQADHLRNERLEPLARGAAETWQKLRQGSSVDLGPVRLEGDRRSNRRRVALDVTVEGLGSAALGVMSQGELHALGLSLFLPRATLEESPFRFVVIDDPVQAMDPAKVEGLAEVLFEVAKTRQVVVFTHDDRLPAAVRRQAQHADQDRAPVTIWQVVRREGSTVEVKKTDDPVSRYLSDARAVAKAEAMPVEVRRQVVPGLCRSAVEAACHEIVRRRRRLAGHDHAEVERAVTELSGVRVAVEAVLFPDGNPEDKKVPDVLSNRFGSRARATYLSCKDGAHDGHRGDLEQLVRDVALLVADLRR
ncbi:AAA family ATPase [Geodermatophilus sp. SYSU D00815]